ncbi:MAG: DUF4440 domain-containing protein [Methylotenera sp.]
MSSNNIKSIIEASNLIWNQALNTGNTKALSALYAENAILSPGDGKTRVGHIEIEALFKSFIENGVHNHTLEVIEVGGNEKVIYQISKWNANGAELSGNTPSFGGITMSVLEQDNNGKWLTQSHVWNAGN